MHSTNFSMSLRETATPTLRQATSPAVKTAPNHSLRTAARVASTVARHVLYAPQVLLALPLLMLMRDGEARG